MPPCGQEHMSCLAADIPIHQNMCLLMQFWGEHQDVFRTMQQYLRKCKKLAPIHLEPPSWRGLVTGIVLALFTYKHFHFHRACLRHFHFRRGCFHYFQSHRGSCPYTQDFWTCNDIVCSDRFQRAYLSQEWIVVISINTVMILEAFIAAGL